MTSPNLYRKKPVVIEAMQLDSDNAAEVAEWCSGRTTDSYYVSLSAHVFIDTLEGTMRADVGDYIIKGVQGEFYPCKPDIFVATYERVE